jgi:hypothetical protein
MGANYQINPGEFDPRTTALLDGPEAGGYVSGNVVLPIQCC